MAGPVVAGDPLARPVLGGVQGAEARAEPGGVQRRPQAGGDDADGVRAGREQFLQPFLPLDRPDGRGVRRPLHFPLEVGGHRPAGGAGRAVRGQVHRGPAAAAVEHGDVVRHVHRDPAQRLHRFVRGRAGLEHVPDHQRDPEALAGLRPSAEGQRDGQPGVVDPVQQAPQAVEHAEYPAAAPGRPGHHGVEQPVVPVVVPDQGGAAGQDGCLGAAGQERRRVPQRQRGLGTGILAEHGAEPLPGGHELGHVLLEPGPGLGRGRPVAWSAVPPAPEERPGRVEVPLDVLAWFVLREGAQGQRDGPGLGRLLPGGIRPGRRAPLGVGPVGRADAPQPGAPVRPVGSLHPLPPVRPVRRRMLVVMACCHGTFAARIPRRYAGGPGINDAYAGRARRMRAKAVTYGLTSAGAAAAAAVGAWPVDPGRSWYSVLAKPSWQPPPRVFGLVWTPLYASIAWAGGHALLRTTGRQRRALAASLAANLTVNAAWNWLFFGMRNPRAGLAGTLLLDLSNAELIRRTARTDPRAAAALVPYALWCAFATALNADIVRRNR